MKQSAKNQDNVHMGCAVAPLLPLERQQALEDWLLFSDAGPALLVAKALAAALRSLPPDRRPQALHRLREEHGHHLCHAPPEADAVADIATRARIAALLATACHALANRRPAILPV